MPSTRLPIDRLKFHYSLDSAVVLDPVEGPPTLAMLKDAGVTCIWIWGFFFGKLWSPVADMVRARDILEAYGFETGVIQLPVGHPGNSLNPEDESLDLKLPETWRYRIDLHGNPVYYCADIEQTMIEDNRKSIEVLYEAGFTRFFMDDDLRLEVFGSEIGGCFCDFCLAEFNGAYGRAMTREGMQACLLDKETNREVLRDWTTYSCSKVTRFMKSMELSGVQLGIMVMHFGDERHGIDIPSLRRDCERVMLRVGESHFEDGDFATPADKAMELSGILFHMNLMGQDDVYSETTVFPPRSLTPDHLLFKAKMAVAAGVPNILFMSGSWLITEDYWSAMSRPLRALRETGDELLSYERSFPVHIAVGTHGSYGEEIAPSDLPVLAGLPAKPVRGGDDETPGDLLLFFGDYELTPDWLHKAVAYPRVIFDLAAFKRNESLLAAGSLLSHMEVWEDPEPSVERLRAFVRRGSADFPMMIAGENIALLWLKEAGSVILLNLVDHDSTGVLSYGGYCTDIAMKGLEMAVVSLEERPIPEDSP